MSGLITSPPSSLPPFPLSILPLLLPQDYAGRVNSIDFHRTHDLLVTAADDDSIRIVDTAAATPARPPLYSKKYGVANIAFTHDPASVVYSSNKVSGGWGRRGGGV